MHRDTTDLAEALSPLLEARGLDLVDVEIHGSELTVFVDRAGGVGLDDLGEATRDVSAELDRLDPMPGRYTLSVSSPGLERRLRTPAHFGRAVGETVTVRLDAGTPDVRRITGRLSAADDAACTVTGPEVPGGELRVDYDRIERARTVFEWGPAPRPNGSPKGGSPKTGSRQAESRQAESRQAGKTTERVTRS
jgi:ribosome maturation factor RimP